MFVYGDFRTEQTCEQALESVVRALKRIGALGPGLERHAALVRAFMSAAELAQGVADADFEARGVDAPSNRQTAANALLMSIAEQIAVSWDTGLRADIFPEIDVDHLRESLAPAGLITTSRAEGYDFYALYPELYVEAARRSGLPAKTVVIGIRSIGLGLAALIAAALGAKPPKSFRPVGHPFRRELRAETILVAEALSDPAAPVAIVDEGPGLSGSSFGAVVEWLQSLGVAASRIHLFPSHEGGPGPEAAEQYRGAWAHSARHCAGFDEVIGDSTHPSRSLRSWIGDLLGTDGFELTDFFGGAWRKIVYADPAQWPSCDPRQERRKYLVSSGADWWLARFAGLGDTGEHKLALARTLHEGGFTSEPVGLCHGFLVERWVRGTPLPLSGFDKARLIDWLGSYLGYRARHCVASQQGASLGELTEMAGHNAELALAGDFAMRLRRWFESRPVGPCRLTPVETDSRLHAWEFLVTPAGKLVKTDALDHAAAHDLVGCQDIAWDIAAAGIEHDLSSGELESLRIAVEAGSGREVDPRLVAFYTPCYLAFQIGLWTFATAGPDWEKSRQFALRERYMAKLGALLL
ncbi:hypothetical protein KEU06_02790 [Pseudaminobacter sp. 19-2017]|uniref:Uncharacterized protein n=1 Tax=Pseudaminobacter soli (ex Zhang et al. 2022) TaxID=2831468 RepID=A0A942I1S2_9HYPH|nr:hypothetical protein [Pseudaminobacter soli]MBS3647553.1 hypothetical protein [Pseudaminobacter soli]